MPTHDDFLQAILASPADDGPRLVYADWLDEQGDPLGEFIRVQCRIATLQRDCTCVSCVRRRGGGQRRNGPCDLDRERPPLRRRERALLDKHGRWWLPHVEGLVQHPNPLGWLFGERGHIPVEFRRGFVDSVTIDLARWMRHGPALVRTAPLTAVQISDREPACSLDSAGWHREAPGVAGRSVLPAELYRSLFRAIGQPWQRAAHSGAVYFSTREQALAALALTALNHARRLAKLPELPRPGQPSLLIRSPFP